MSWENDEYTGNLLPVVTKPVSKKRSTSKSKARRQERIVAAAMQSLALKKDVNTSEGFTKDEILDLHGKSLKDLPVDHPLYAGAKILILRNNELREVDMSKLPRNLIALDVRTNNILEFTNVESIPKDLETIHFDNNLVKEHPPFPPSVTFISSSGNPLKSKDLFKNILDGLPEKTIIWFHKEGSQGKPPFTEEESSGKSFLLKVYDDETMRAIMGYANEFIKETICHSRISGTYISSKVVAATNLLVEVEKGEVVAIAIFKLDYEGGGQIYVDILCSSFSNRGGGSRLMKVLVEYMKTHVGIRKITLDSVSTARGFYEKLGFTRCIDGELCPMELNRDVVLHRGGSRRRTRKHRA